MLLLFATILVTLAIVGSRYKAVPEDWYGAKILGYGFLGSLFVMVRLDAGFYWVPIGFLFGQALLIRHVPNRLAKRIATMVGLVGLILTAMLFGLGPQA